MIGLCPSVANLLEIYVMRPKCQVRWLRFHFKRMLIMGLGNRLRKIEQKDKSYLDIR